MNTVRVPRTLDADRGVVALYARMIALAIVLCVVVFAGCFVLGRSERPAGAQREALSSSISSASAGAAIELRLTATASIAAPVKRRPAQPASSHHVLSSPLPAVQPALASAPASAPTPATPAVSAPVVSAPAAPAPAPVRSAPAPVRSAPASAPTSAPSGAGRKGSGSTSFDSSG